MKLHQAMASNSSSSDTNDQHAALLARIAALELENKLLRESIDKKQPSPGNNNGAPDNTKIYFDGLRCSRFDADANISLFTPIDESSVLSNASPFDSRPKSSSSSVNKRSLKQSLTASSNRMLSQSLRDLNLNTNVLEDEVCFHLDESNRFSSLQNNDINGNLDDNNFHQQDSKADGETANNNSRKIITSSQSMPLDSSSTDSERRFTTDNNFNQLTAGTISRAMELQRTIHVLNKLLVRKTKSFGNGSVTGGSNRRAFSRFYLLSADVRVTRKSSDWNNESRGSGGRNYLDPVVLRYADCVDRYPALEDDSSNQQQQHVMSTNELSIFCFLDGLKIHLIPGVVEKKKLGWMKDVDYKVLVFTDGDGSTSHGISITVWEEIDTSSSSSQPYHKAFVSQVQMQRDQRRAARLIARNWKHCKDYSSTTTNACHMQHHDETTGKTKRFSRTTLRMKNMKAGLRTKLKRTSLNVRHIPQTNLIPYPDRVIRLGQESYAYMNESAKMGDRCFVQRCYVMLGGLESEQYLQFRSLRHLVEMESGNKANRDIIRHKFLDAVRAKMYLNPTQARLSHRSFNNFDIVTNENALPTFEINMPEFNFVDTHNIHLPLSQVSCHWGLAMIFQRISPIDLMALLRLLLIERSVLIIGESSIVVSSCACALLDLLRPYRWASTFMPLLPEDMIDFVQSPVPFITGMAVSSKESAIRIENDQRVTEAMSNGLNVVNLTLGKVSITAEPGIKSLVHTGLDETSSKLTLYRNRLKTLRPASCDSFSTFLDQGISAKELVTLSGIHLVVQNYMKSFAGDIASTSDGWQRYGIHLGGMDDDEDDGTTEEDMGGFAFYPKLFIQPLRKKIETQLQFQEMMSHSQLFIEFVTAKRNTWMARQKMARGDIGKFIANWIFQRWRQRNMPR